MAGLVEGGALAATGSLAEGVSAFSTGAELAAHVATNSMMQGITEGGALAAGAAAVGGIAGAVMNTENPTGGTQAANTVASGKVESSAFADNTTDISSGRMPIRDMPVPVVDTDLMHWLAQYVKINQFTWDTGGTVAAFDPWTLWHNIDSVARKLSNYYLLSGKLRVKFITNGNAYQYGRLTFGYLPISTNIFRTQTAGLVGFATTNLPFQFNIDPSSDSVIELELPFFASNEVVNDNGFGMNTIGAFQPLVVATLASVSTGVLAPYCDVTVYAAMVDVRLQHRTSYFPTSTKNEYNGILSKPIATAANIAGAFTKIPVIGKYADSFSKNAGKIANLTTAFGFSAPNNIEKPSRVIMSSMGTMAQTDVEDCSHVLALDPRASTIYEPKMFGLTDQDELAFSNIWFRESLVAAYNWTDATAIGGTVADIDNSPFFTTQTLPLAPSHLAYVALPFAQFRGSIRYRFVVPCTTFHTGRIQISYEPNSGAIIGDPTNTNFNVIWDLKKQQEIIFEVPYTRESLSKLNTTNGSTWASFISNTKAGHIVLTVLSSLRAGGVATTCKVLVYISAGPDFEVMSPNFDIMRNNSIQLGWFPSAVTTAFPANVAIPGYPLTATYTVEEFHATSTIIDNSNDVNVIVSKGDMQVSTMFSQLVASERFLSWRELFKRYSIVKSVPMPGHGAGTYGRVVHNHPHVSGYTKDSGGNTYFCEEAINFLNYVRPCFASHRGSFRHKFVDVSLNAPANSLLATNLNVARGEQSCLSYTGGEVGGYMKPQLLTNFCTGGILNSAYISANLEVQIPWVNSFNFIQDGWVYAGNSQPCCLLLQQCPLASSDDSTHYVVQFTAAADDFNMYFYLGPPVLYSWTIA